MGRFYFATLVGSFVIAATATAAEFPTHLTCTGSAPQGLEHNGPVEYTIGVKDAASTPPVLYYKEHSPGAEDGVVLHFDVEHIVDVLGGGLSLLGPVQGASLEGTLVFRLFLPPACPDCPGVLTVTNADNFRRQVQPTCQR